MRVIFVCVILFMFVGCYEVERNCKDYQTGTFKSEIKINDSTYISLFVRTNNLQIETYNNKVDSSEVRWINDCEVVFKTINPKNRIERKDIHLKILTTTDSSYTFEYSYVGDKTKQKGIAKKID
ncbi:DNA topoisomerase IV [Hanstruepera marina]|uniref:DNA topoisomerase IV n=1 Tax=Hanstruepera marina TaxID=2873265 RepID=UPI001CA63EAB|nr:DNA topoisomerase IV [Hanstruepera marina]